MSFSDLMWALPGLFAMWFAGRLILAELPPGELGAGGPRAPVADAALAWAIGWLAVSAQTWLWEWITGRPSAWALAWPWILWSLLRNLRGPGRVPPRSPQSRPWVEASERPWTRALLAAAVLAWVWSTLGPSSSAELGLPRLPLVEGRLPLHLCGEWPLWLFGGERPGYALSPVMLGACACIVYGTLVRAQRHPAASAALILFLVLAPAAPRWLSLGHAPRSGIGAPLVLCVTAAGAAEWLRVADRRGRVLACLGLVAIPWVEPRLWAASAVMAALLLLFSPPKTRPTTALWIGPALLLATLASAGLTIPRAQGEAEVLTWAPLAWQPLTQAMFPTGPWGLWNLLGLLSLASAARALVKSDQNALEGKRPALCFAAWIALGITLAPWLAGGRIAMAWPQDPAQAAAHWVTLWCPLVALFVGLTLVPARREPSPVQLETTSP